MTTAVKLVIGGLGAVIVGLVIALVLLLGGDDDGPVITLEQVSSGSATPDDEATSDEPPDDGSQTDAPSPFAANVLWVNDVVIVPSDSSPPESGSVVRSPPASTQAGCPPSRSRVRSSLTVGSRSGGNPSQR